jgi:hypothetical protein
MKNQHFEPELSSEAINEMTQLRGSGYRQVNQIQDDFGDTSWLDGFIEDYLGG